MQIGPCSGDDRADAESGHTRSDDIDESLADRAHSDPAIAAINSLSPESHHSAMLAGMSRLSLNHVLAKNLRHLREQQGLSQEGFAAKCRLHRTYIGAIERGERNVTLKTLELIARALGVDPLGLLKE